MTIRSIRLHPFAGVQEKTIDLGPGLNLVLGPNEAGKSTLFKALLHGLFSPAVLTTQQTEKIMGDFFPVTGGDVIRVEIVLEREGNKQVRIKKIWKRGNRKGSASLVLSDGTEITDEREVQSRIEHLLPVSPATMKTVLLSSQTDLQATMDRMKQDMKVRQELGTVLRRGVMETGGVSVERFRAILEREYEKYFKKWNREQQYPENNRGIRNPYKKDYGALVEAFYTLERARLKYRETLEFENAYDEINEKISQLSSRRGKIKKSYDELNPLKKAVQQRRSRESEVKLLEKDIETYREVNKLWPVREERLKALDAELEAEEGKIESLKRKIVREERRKEEEALRERIARLESLKSKMDRAREEERETPRVTSSKLSDLRTLQAGLERVNAHIEAAKLSVSLEGKNSTEVLWGEVGTDDLENIVLQYGKSEKRSASGGFILEAGGFTLRVYSGEGDIEELIAEREQKERSLEAALEELQAADPAEAEAMAEQYREKMVQRVQAEQRYYEELGDDDLQTLRTQLG
ncbi:MAG: AAA family ATPase, partial [Spirochaetaceae bacterium]